MVEDARNSMTATPDSVSYARAFAFRDQRLAWHPFATRAKGKVKRLSKTASKPSLFEEPFHLDLCF